MSSLNSPSTRAAVSPAIARPHAHCPEVSFA